jgi:hypothetical protein
MSNPSLERQADRAERLARQTVDSDLKTLLEETAKDYRRKAQENDGLTVDASHIDAPQAAIARAASPRPTWVGLGLGLSEQPRATSGF